MGQIPGAICQGGGGVGGLRSVTFVIIIHCYYTPKCSSWSIVFKSSICQLGKHCISPVFKMASKKASVTE